MHVYRETGTAAQPFQIGYYMPNGSFEAVDFTQTRNQAARVVNYLNGGAGNIFPS